MAVSELPGNPNAVWTVKKRADGEALICLLYFVSLCRLLKFPILNEWLAGSFIDKGLDCVAFENTRSFLSFTECRPERHTLDTLGC